MIVKIDIELWLERGNLVGVTKKLCEWFVVFSLLVRRFTFCALKVPKIQFDLFEIMKQKIQLYHFHMNEPKNLYLCYCQNNTLLDSPLLGWCLFFFTLLFDTFFQCS